MAGGYSKQRATTAAVPRLDPKRDLPFEPRNEAGVLFVFARVAERLGLEVESVQVDFPDCVATSNGRRVRIEFEYRSKSFELHGHDPKGCDLIVCWRHDWPSAPAGLSILELRKVFSLSREVFIVAYRDEYWQRLPSDREPTGLWSVPPSAGPNDLLLIYRPQVQGEEGALTHVFRVVTAPQREPKGFRGEPDWMASIELVSGLQRWVPFSRLKALGAHGGIENRPRRTRQWPALYRELTSRARPSHSLKRLELL